MSYQLVARGGDSVDIMSIIHMIVSVSRLNMDKLVLILILAAIIGCINSTAVLPKWVERIINGEDAAPGSHPHQVALAWAFNGGLYFLCGGSVIRENVVLTAAHCVSWDLSGDFIVIINDHSLSDYKGNEQAINVQQIIPNDDFINGWDDINNQAYPHDIAILMLADKVNDTSTLIDLPEPGTQFVGDTCVISGWGYNESYGDTPDILQEAYVTIMSKSECDYYWGRYGYDMFAGQICVFAGEDPLTGISACSGDSGGPLVCQDSNGKDVLAGVTSWGVSGCIHPDYGVFWPSVYASVSYYRSWIDIQLSRFSIGRG